jgi:diguanylate cyclase (GGDEF)-like protein
MTDSGGRAVILLAVLVEWGINVRFHLKPVSSNLLKVLVVAAAYCLAAKVGFAFTREGKEFTAFWPATGSSLFFTFLWGPVALPGIALGSFLIQLTLGVDAWVALTMPVPDVLESAVPFYLMRRLDAAVRLYTVRDVMAFFGAVLLGTFIDSVGGNLILCMSGSEGWTAFFHNMMIWWAANFTGGLILTPLFVSHWRWREFLGHRRWERLVVVLIAVFFCYLTFIRYSTGLLSEMEYLLLPLVAWAALRLGLMGLSWTLVVTTVLAVIGTMTGVGPFREQSVDDALFLVQAFACVTAIAGYLMAASVYELRETDRALRESHEWLEARVEERTLELKELALQDTLTGLPNRRWMLDHLSYALGRVKRDSNYQFGLLFLDLDRFKVINDSLGHVAGDDVLVTVAGRLKQAIREGDAVARLGGDEFTIFVNDFQHQTASVVHVAERVQKVLDDPVEVAGRFIHRGASIGIALSVTGYSTPEDILRDADTAMYRAKQAGAGRIQVFDPGMHVSAMGRLVMENDLRRALQQRQFFLMYQPIISYKTGHLAGFEALLRWKHPERGLIPPDEFIPVAEEMRLMGPIGQWVLEEACAFLGAWRKGRPQASALVISVNISAMQLREPDFVEQVESVLRKTELPGNRLKLELTESILIENTAQLTAALDTLRGLGIEVMIDDFGTGFSSLSYLAHLPMDALKIDRSFISGGHKTAEAIEIVRCIVAMATSLLISTLAAGVESSEQDAWLKTMGCDYAQGYYHSRPMEEEAAREMLNKVFGAGGVETDGGGVD